MSEVASEGQAIARLFEQPPDAVSFYADLAQVLGTGNEVVLQFYETISAPPGSSGRIDSVRSRLRATVVLNPAHALNIGQLLLTHANRARPTTQRPDAPQGGKPLARSPGEEGQS